MEYSKIFKIRELPPLETSSNNYFSEAKADILFLEINSDKENMLNISAFNNKFVGSYYECYQCHGNAVFSPSDLWFIMCLSYSKYANENPEEIKKYVNPDFDDNKKELMITFEDLDSDWKKNIKDMVEKVKENMYKNNLINILQNNLDCATCLEKMACDTAILKTTEKFFYYSFVSRCGFNHIKLIGDIQDWKLLENKIQDLKNYGTSSKWKNYIDKVLYIIKKFIECFDEPDVDFFEKMIHADYEYGFYGDSADSLSGWILELFYGFKESYILSEIPDIFADVDAKFFDQYGKKSNIKITSGFYGCRKTCEYDESNQSYLKYLNNENDNKEKKIIKVEDPKIIYDFRPVIYCQIEKVK